MTFYKVQFAFSCFGASAFMGIVFFGSVAWDTACLMLASTFIMTAFLDPKPPKERP